MDIETYRQNVILSQNNKNKSKPNKYDSDYSENNYAYDENDSDYITDDNEKCKKRGRPRK